MHMTVARAGRVARGGNSAEVYSGVSLLCTPGAWRHSRGTAMRIQSRLPQTAGATGGTPPYTWLISAGALPGGLALGAGTGVSSGPPGASGAFNFTVKATDTSGSPHTAIQSLSIVIAPALTITATSLTGGAAGVTYSQTAGVTGGTPPYAWSISAGALPARLMLAAGTGAISGAPAAPGTSTFTVRVTDSDGVSVLSQFALTVSLSLSITTSSLAAGTVGSACSQPVVVSGGTPPYTWALISGAFPAALSLSAATGFIAGTPRAGGTPPFFTIQITDSAAATGTLTFHSDGLAYWPFALTTTFPSSFPAGSRTMEVDYNGDANYLPTSSAVRSMTVAKATRSVTLSSSIPTAPFGTPVTVYASMILSGATGDVTFSDPQGSPVTGSISGGVAYLVAEFRGSRTAIPAVSGGRVRKGSAYLDDFGTALWFELYVRRIDLRYSDGCRRVSRFFFRYGRKWRGLHPANGNTHDRRFRHRIHPAGRKGRCHRARKSIDGMRFLSKRMCQRWETGRA